MPALTCPNPACGHTARVIDTAPAGAVYGCPKCHTPLPPVPERKAPAWLTGPRAAWLVCRAGLVAVLVDFALRWSRAVTSLDELVACAEATFFTVFLVAAARSFEGSRQNPATTAPSGTKDQQLRNS